MPAFPQQYTSTVSHWQATNRGPSSLWNCGRDDPLPTDAVDYLIIGAGVTGTSLAYHLTRPGAAGEGKSVVILDAKDVASCASGRNGGHVGPRGWDFSQLVKPLKEGGAGLTPQDAVDVTFFELDNLDLVEDIVKKEGIDADFWRGERIEVVTEPASVAGVRKSREAFNKAQAGTRHAGRKAKWEFTDDPKEAKKISRVKKALAVKQTPSGSWHPHRGVTALMRLALASKSSDCKFFSWAPVTGFKRQGELWEVDCGQRGVIRARQVMLATNAYTRHLFPDDLKANKGIASHVVPYRGHAGVIVPPVTYSGSQALKGAYGIERGPYLIQSPANGHIIMGPFNATVLSDIGGPKDLFYIEDDSKVVPKFQDWLASYCKDNYDAWGEETPGEGLNRAWSGIMCHSIDLMPLVGPVPNQPGLWISAGYNGHGMAMIINITRSIAEQMKTGKWDERMPRCYAITSERLERAAEACGPLIPEADDIL